MSKKKSNTSNKKIITMVVSLLLIVLAASAFYMVNKEDNPKSTTGESRNCKTYVGHVEQCIEDYIGLSQEEAINRAKQFRYVPKIVSIDGVKQVNTDIGGAIIYFEIENGVVSRGYFDIERKDN